MGADLIAAGAVLATAVVTFIVAWWALDKVRGKIADQEMREQFGEDMKRVELPDWNGATYDWPQAGLAQYLDDAYAYTGPVPVSDVSGPMHVMDEPSDDTDAFIDAMRRRTDWTIARMTTPGTLR
jgi:hypothetical protein